jgi:hypothetical protein
MESGIVDVVSLEFSFSDLVCKGSVEMEKIPANHQHFLSNRTHLVWYSIRSHGIGRIAYIYTLVLFILHQKINAFLPLTLHLLLRLFPRGI